MFEHATDKSSYTDLSYFRLPYESITDLDGVGKTNLKTFEIRPVRTAFSCKYEMHNFLPLISYHSGKEKDETEYCQHTAARKWICSASFVPLQTCYKHLIERAPDFTDKIWLSKPDFVCKSGGSFDLVLVKVEARTKTSAANPFPCCVRPDINSTEN